MHLNSITARRMFVIVAGLLGAATVLRAEPKELVSSLTLDQAVAEALRNNPQVRALQAKWEAARERPAQERTLPDPMVSFKTMDTIDNYQFQEKRVEVEQTFPWFGTLSLRGKVAEKDADLAGRDRQAVELEVVMAVKEDYFDLYAVQHTLSITRSEEEVLKRMESIAESRYSTGEATEQDVIKAQAEITMLKQRLLDLEQQQHTLEAKLDLLMDRPVDAPVSLAVTAPEVETVADTGGLLALAQQSRPEIGAARTQVERDEAQRALMQKEFFPDYRIGVEYRNVGADYSSVNLTRSDNMVMFTIGFDLPLWQTKYRAGLREAEKSLESSQDALEAAQRQTAYDVQDARFKLQTDRDTVELYKASLIPQAESRFNASEAAYRTGKADFLDLLESERFLLNARVMEAMAEGALGMQLARLERAVGASLTPAAGSERNGK
jgi:outer membrane protein TolC